MAIVAPVLGFTPKSHTHSLDVEALGRDVTGLDPRIDTGHAVTALGESGRGLLTAIAPAVSVRVPLPVGGSGAIARFPESLA